ncbi:MAG: M10 family metallopeptidase C-terminal domain-containing protein [Burkholderiaceae bacterium]|jgi:serralysin|nr:M10 family metallopeptidase C-terminal domain-containing protein [Burkholderiaceae bacterium]
MATSKPASKTGNREIDGLLYGTKWDGFITYSFPDSPSDYSYPAGYNEPKTNFAQAPVQFQSAITHAASLIMQYTNAKLQHAGTNHADIMVAQSSLADPTAYGSPPANWEQGGDIWIGTKYNYSIAKAGNYEFRSALHEFGHAMGLKHPHEANGSFGVLLPAAHDSTEYSIMSYKSYQGSTAGTLTGEVYGQSTTYMANDILALQTLYGANYNTYSSDTIYTWSTTTGQAFINGAGQIKPGANKIFQTTWDGGGTDTYDLSNYTTNLNIDLNPGASSLFSTAQQVYQGNGHYAAGNVYNAYLFNNDQRSLIENANGGSGDDILTGNQAANVLIGNNGNDTFNGRDGNDRLFGDWGIDRLHGNNGDDFIRGGVDNDFLWGENGKDELIGDEGNDKLWGNAGDDKLWGSTGVDELYGDSGSDALNGEDGNDILNGGAGGDVLSGGAGNDRFVFEADSSGAVNDLIFGFGDSTGNEDVIDLSAVVKGVTAANFATWKGSNITETIFMGVPFMTTIRFGDDSVGIFGGHSLDYQDFVFG